MDDPRDGNGRRGGPGSALAWVLAPCLVLLPAMPGRGQAPDWEKIDLPDGAIYQDPSWQESDRFTSAPSSRLAADRAGRLYFANGTRLHVGTGTHWTTLSKPAEPGVLTEQRALAAGSGGQVVWGEWSSQDGGATWSKAGLPSWAFTAAMLADGTRLIGTSYDAVERAEGGSDAWTRAYMGHTYGHIRQFAVSEPVIMAIPSYSQVLVSLDSGKRWQEWSLGFYPVTGAAVRAARFRSPGLGTPLFVVLNRSGGRPHALARLHVYYPGLDTLEAALPDSAITSLWFDPAGNFWVGTRGQGIHVSRDQGRTFTAVNGGLGSLHVEALESAADGTLYALTHDGLYRARAEVAGPSGIRLRPGGPSSRGPGSPGRARLHLPGLPASLRGEGPKARLSILADGRMIILPADPPSTRFPR